MSGTAKEETSGPIVVSNGVTPICFTCLFYSIYMRCSMGRMGTAFPMACNAYVMGRPSTGYR